MDEQIAWEVNIIRVSSAAADLTTLHLYAEWLKIPDMPEPGITDRSWCEQLHRGLNGWMATCDCNSLAATLPYIGFLTIVGRAILHKATYLFYTNSKIYHRGINPGSVLPSIWWVQATTLDSHKFIITSYQQD